jgi:PAP_fibrillin
MRLLIYLLLACQCHELVVRAFTARQQLAHCSTAAAWPLAKHGRRPHSGATLRDSSAPSDTASLDDEDAVDTSAIPYEPSTSEALVTNMLDLIPTGGFASDGAAGLTTEQRAAISEALYRLEAVNPTPRPATSPLINGVWELRYVGGYTADWALPSPTRQLALFLYSGGYSPGVFAYTLAQQLPSALVELQSSDDDDSSTSTSPLEITISRSPQPRVEASVAVKLLGGAVSGKVTVKARLEVESDLRLRETYESVTVLGQSSPYSIPSQLQYARDLYVTYLDDDLLVVRDGSGVPEVLVRKAKKFSRNWGTEPSAINDMVPPGDGEDAQF